MTMKGEKRIGIIGCGQWGPNQLRTFFLHPRAEVTWVCDKDPRRLSAMQSVYPGIRTTENPEEVIRAENVDAVVITTPVASHFDLASDALKNGKDVLCEKPLTMTSAESRELIGLAAKKKAVLMVGHVFLYSPGILKLKEVIDSGECGKIYYLHAQRTNLGPMRNDVNSVYDLASHDISIFNYLLGSVPKVLTAAGKCYLRREIEDVAFISLEYPGNVFAHIHVSWLDPKKIRQITVVGDRKMATWDDLSSAGPVEIFSKHVEKDPYYKDYGEFHLLAKSGETVIPHVKSEEPLRRQTAHFMDCILKRTQPLTDGQNGLEVVRTLEEIGAKLRAGRSAAWAAKQA